MNGQRMSNGETERANKSRTVGMLAKEGGSQVSEARQTVGKKNGAR